MSEYNLHIKVEDFNYQLPDERIAKYPAGNRDESKLLVYRNGEITDSRFSHLPELLPLQAFLVFNNTRVIHARLIFRKVTGSAIEIFCLEPHEPSDYQVSFQKKGEVVWRCLVGNAKRWKTGILSLQAPIGGQMVELKAEKAGRDGNFFLVRFSWDDGFTFAEIIENTGIIPIPPYLNRDSEEEDSVRYQTVYASVDGSVAAPTAGLHFTAEVMSRLKKKGIGSGELTLHVGAGTFQPVKSETIAGHTMHNELVSVRRELVEDLLCNEGKIIAVGTTSLRSLESLYWLGAKLLNKPDNSEPIEIGQWEPYQDKGDVSLTDSLNAVLEYLNINDRGEIRFSTRLIIIPGYRFRVVTGLITNFHQPLSTLLLLVSAFLGPDWKRVYQYALDHGFRFLSYGDSNLYLRPD